MQEKHRYYRDDRGYLHMYLPGGDSRATAEDMIIYLLYDILLELKKPDKSEKVEYHGPR